MAAMPGNAAPREGFVVADHLLSAVRARACRMERREAEVYNAAYAAYLTGYAAASAGAVAATSIADPQEDGEGGRHEAARDGAEERVEVASRAAPESGASRTPAHVSTSEGSGERIATPKVKPRN